MVLCSPRATNRMNSSVHDSPERLGQFVRARRLANKMTQRQLGELAGVGTRVVSELERGKPTLRMDVVNRVLEVFGQMLGRIESPREEIEL